MSLILIECTICHKPKDILDNNLICKDCNKICEIEECQNKKHGIFVLCKQHLKQKIPGRKWTPKTECYNTLQQFSELSSTVNFNINNDNLDQLSNSTKSKISLICKKCKYEWYPTISDIINHGSGCPECAGSVPYTLQRLLYKAKQLNIDEIIDFSKVTEKHINNGKKTKIPLICKKCHYEWSPSISHIINSGSGCPECSGNIPYTLQRLLDKANKLKIDERINFSKVTEEHISNSKSKIPLICKKCNYKWNPTIHSIITSGNRCSYCSGKASYTLEILLDKAKKLNIDERLDFSKVTEEHINGVDSKIPLICKKCQYEWETSINSIINSGSGCPECSGNIPYTLQRLLDKVKFLNITESIDFSKVSDEDVSNCYSKIPLICKKCKYNWKPSINSIVRGSGCPDCAGSAPYTLQRLLDKANKLKIDEKIDFSKVTEEHISNSKSKIPLICKKCNYEWSPAIGNIISGNGCPYCGGKIPYTLQRLLDKASLLNITEIIDFSKVTEEHIDNGAHSKIPLICKKCNYKWNPTIHSIITSGNRCSYCSGKASYTLEILLDKAKKLNIDERLDFSKVTEEHIYNGGISKIPLICKKCNYEWNPTISGIINSKSGCPYCSGRIAYTLQYLLDKAKKLNIDERLDFSKVTEEHIDNGAHSKIPLICKKCKHTWNPTISSVINSSRGCPKCCSSKGEQALEYSCKKLGINYEVQKQFDSLIYKRNLRIDMYIPVQENINLLNIKFPICVEYDGQHYKGGHFPMERHDEESTKRHLEQVEKDKIKNEWCLSNGHHMVRIPYTSWEGGKNKENEMVEILKKAFSELQRKVEPHIYCSDITVYE